jgi:pyruvate formate-lyase activating enzyme-like uncharacterized protein
MTIQEQLALLYPAIDSEVIELVFAQAQSFVLDYCNLNEVPSGLNSVLLDMCKQDINKLLSEGFASESAGGSSVSYSTDYTEVVYKRLKKHKRLKTL